MRNKKFQICFIVFFLLICLFSVSNTSIIDEKISLENSIREKTEKILEKIIGNKNFIVLVNVELDLEQIPKETKQAQPIYPGMALSEQEYLPGISYSYIPTESPNFPTNKAVIKKISLVLTVDQNTDPALLDRAKKELFTLLGLDTARGDFINIEKIQFTVPKPGFKDIYHSWSGLFYWLGTMLFLALFFLGPLRIILKNIAKAMEMRVETQARVRSDMTGLPGANPAGTIGLPGGPLELSIERKRQKKEEEEQTMKKRFGFINETNMKNLIYLIKKQPAEKIAIITSYLPSVYSTQVINSLTIEQQREVFKNLSNTKLFEPEEVDKLEQEIKTRIDYLVGGETYFSNILDEVDREIQENILSTLETENPALAEKLRKSLVYFEDIIYLDKTALQKVIHEIQIRGDISLAVALKTASEDIKTKIMDVLTEGARAILAEQMDLLGEVSAKKVEEQQKKIAIIIKELIRAEEITLNKE